MLSNHPGQKSRCKANWSWGSPKKINWKAILKITSADIRKAVGVQQLCAGQVSGAEACRLHAMRKKDNPESEAILMVDASNASTHLTMKLP